MTQSQSEAIPMKDVLLALLETQTATSAALQAVADHVTAIRETLIFHYPEIEDDLKAHIAAEQRKSHVSVQSLLLQTAKLKEMIEGLPN
jgi:hypothetical protein